jgi:hypothetical protein
MAAVVTAVAVVTAAVAVVTAAVVVSTAAGSAAVTSEGLAGDPTPDSEEDFADQR